MENEKQEQEKFGCPLGRLFQDLEKIAGRKSDFCRHMTQSRVEFLKAIRSLMDAKIEDLEKKTAPKEAKKATKIEVE